jgi:hypothetical protein
MNTEKLRRRALLVVLVAAGALSAMPLGQSGGPILPSPNYQGGGGGP